MEFCTRKCCLLLIFWTPLLKCAPSSFLVHKFGTDDKLGTDYPEAEGSLDYLLWEKENLPEGEFSKEFSLCFSMKYLTLDYWSTGQKTIFRIFQGGVKHYWIRINHSPPRGTLILNRGSLWSGGLGSFR